MKTMLAMSVLAMIAAGCSDYNSDRARTEWSEESQVAQPASSNLGQAERAGYINEATNPESWPMSSHDVP